MAKKHAKFGCLKPLEGTKKCAVRGLQDVPVEQAGRFAKRCDVKGVGLAFGRWRGSEGQKAKGWAVTHHGKAVSAPVGTREEAVRSMSDYMAGLISECKSCK